MTPCQLLKRKAARADVEAGPSAQMPGDLGFRLPTPSLSRLSMAMKKSSRVAKSLSSRMAR